jgi:hypothetical protein
MGHLSKVDLVDLAEGTQLESAAPHLASCGRCRRELAALRDVIAEAAQIEVPEPSPLFWAHLSSRVREAVAEESPGRPRWTATFGRAITRRVGAAVVVWTTAAALAVVAAVAVRLPSRVPRQPAVSANGGDMTAPGFTAVDDPALSRVAQMAGSLDEDAASVLAPVDEATPHPGVVEESITAMSQGEREELGRIINEEMRRPGS